VYGRCVHEEVNQAEPGSANPDLRSDDRLVHSRQTAWERFVAFIRRIKVHDPRSPTVSIRFIHIPALAHGPAAPLAQDLAEERRQLAFPRPHRFVREDEAPLKKHLR
jgi:hypothetical protein